VVDISHRNFKEQLRIAEELIREMGAEELPVVLVFNKIDRMTEDDTVGHMKRQYPEAVFVSCQQGLGMDDLKKAIVREYEANLLPYRVELKYPQNNLIQNIRKHALIIKEDYQKTSVTLDLRVWPQNKSKLMEVLNGHPQPVAR
jgi:GTP-binding protein HflX